MYMFFCFLACFRGPKQPLLFSLDFADRVFVSLLYYVHVPRASRSCFGQVGWGWGGGGGGVGGWVGWGGGGGGGGVGVGVAGAGGGG